jgi:hypothetical protein
MKDVSQYGVVKNNLPNYVYLRGKCSAKVNMKAALFCVPNQLLLDPKSWPEYPVMQRGPDEEPVVAYRSLQSNSAGVIVCDDPFNVFNPPPPPRGSSHYCLIVEAIDANDPDATWPHSDPIPTTYSLIGWIRNNPGVAQRNMQFEPYRGENMRSWQTSLYLPSK